MVIGQKIVTIQNELGEVFKYAEQQQYYVKFTNGSVYKMSESSFSRCVECDDFLDSIPTSDCLCSDCFYNYFE